jgi:hypothetical protein
MKLWGGYLPFIGFREEPVDEHTRQFFNFPDEVTHMNTFQVEWFGCGVILCLRAVDPDE